jgi:Uma2 family endonuclease
MAWNSVLILAHRGLSALANIAGAVATPGQIRREPQSALWQMGRTASTIRGEMATVRHSTTKNVPLNRTLTTAMSPTPFASPQEPEYAWEVATLFPEQGGWTEEQYLELTDHSKRRIEFTDGRLEFLPMPTDIHESLVEFLFFALHEFVAKRQLGKVRWTGIRLRIRPKKYRFPDIIFLHKDHFHARHNRAWEGADLVMEVVSGDPKDQERDYKDKLLDYKDKLLDYAEAKIAEYWIVDYERRVVIVHRLDGERNAVHGEFSRGQQAESVLLPGFSIDVDALFAVADEIPE